MTRWYSPGQPHQNYPNLGELVNKMVLVN